MGTPIRRTGIQTVTSLPPSPVPDSHGSPSLLRQRNNSRPGLTRHTSLNTLTIKSSDDPFAKVERPVTIIEGDERDRRNRDIYSQLFTSHSARPFSSKPDTSMDVTDQLFGELAVDTTDSSPKRQARASTRPRLSPKLRSVDGSNFRFQLDVRDRYSRRCRSTSMFSYSTPPDPQRGRNFSLGHIAQPFDLAPFDVETSELSRWAATTEGESSLDVQVTPQTSKKRWWTPMPFILGSPKSSIERSMLSTPEKARSVQTPSIPFSLGSSPDESPNPDYSFPSIDQDSPASSHPRSHVAEGLVAFEKCSYY